MRAVIKSVITMLLFGLVFFTQLPDAMAVTYNVITPVASVSQPGSLPWCIAQANLTVAPDLIQFVHAQSLDPAANSITVHATLVITYPIMINGNQIKVGANNLGPQNCFQLQAGATGSTITGLAIVDSNFGINITTNSNCHMIYNNRIGTDWADTTGLGNTYGIGILSHYNSIGRNGASDRNVISDNSNMGILLNTGSSHNVITGNYVGLNNAGSAGLGGQPYGIYINSSRENMIGGDRSLGYGNVVSNNSQYGIVFESAAASGNTVCGNIVGLNLAMDTAVPNNRGIAGVSLEGNTIGLPLANYDNIVAGNTSYNINFWEVGGTRPQNNTIQNNYIGTNPASASFTNGDGIYLNLANRTRIGGNRAALEGNIISGNGGNGGIYLIGNGNSISGNYIGTNVSGSAALQNNTGIRIDGSNNLIGGPNGPGIAYGNVISGNQFNGIFFSSGTGNTLVGNTIGLNANGDVAIANGQNGILTASGAVLNLIGQADASLRNVISGNTFYGISLNPGSGFDITGNYIGCNAAGTAEILNGSGGISLVDSMQNLIQDNFIAQIVFLQNAGSFGNTLVGNVIGVLPDQSSVSGLGTGINLGGGAHGNFIGLKQTGTGNLVANTTTMGITVNGATTVNNGIFGNTITAFGAKGINLAAGGNNDHAYPVIHMAETAQGVSGTASNNDYIEVFIAENDPAGYGGSVSFLGYTTADGSGNWALPAGGYVAGQYICATAANAVHDSSEFSENFIASDPPGTPTHTPTITPTATLTSTQTATQTTTPTITPTLTRSATVTVSPTISATPSITMTLTQSATYTATATPTPTSSYTPTPALAQVDLEGKAILPYPNPANTEMRFLIHLDTAAEIILEIYNFSGERIASVGAALSAGQGQTLVWDCADTASGVYLMRVLKDGNLLETRKIAVVH